MPSGIAQVLANRRRLQALQRGMRAFPQPLRTLRSGWAEEGQWTC